MSFKPKDEIVVVRGARNASAARIIGGQYDDEGEILKSAYVRYHDDLEPLYEWVEPTDLRHKTEWDAEQKAKAEAEESEREPEGDAGTSSDASTKKKGKK